jgi:carboxyl-terminal processing protease
MISPAALRRFGLAILSLALAPCISTLSAEDRTFATSPSLATEATTLVKLLELYHYNRANVHSSDYSEVIPDYMAELDGQHMFFLGTDKRAFTTRYNGATVYSQVAYQGDIDAAYEIYGVYANRVQARVNWIFAELKKPIDLAGNETFAADRTKAEWPATAADSDDHWRLRLKFEVIGELLGARAKDATGPAHSAVTLSANGGPISPVSGAPGAGDPAAVPAAAAEKAAPAGPHLKDNVEKPLKTAVSTDPVEKAKEIVRKRYERMLKNMGDIEGGDLAELYLTSIAALYDPHSNYWSAQDYEEFGIQMKLQLVGIGAVLQLKDDYCTIEELVPGGPADIGHQLKPGDKIIAVAQENKEPVDIIGMKLRKVVEMIRGERGSRVHLTVESSGSTDTSAHKQIVITRDVVKLSSARAHGALFQVPEADGKTVPIGVITLPEFYGPADDPQAAAEKSSASQDVASLIAQLKTAGVKGMVLDLRHNGGGFLGEAINIAGLFIPKGPVVQVVDSTGDKQVDSSENATVAYDGQLAVLTDRFSASASEIVAGALQSYGRAIVVGDSSTHGKGTVQQVIEMKNLTRELAMSPDKTGAAKITIQKFYLPNGSSTQLKGVVADIALPSIDDSLPIGESSLQHALIWDRKPSAPTFIGKPLDARVLDSLREKSLARQARLPEFAYLKKDVDWFKSRQEQKLVLLNLDERRKQKASDDAFIKEIKAERDELAKTDYPHSEFWVAPRPLPKLKAPKTADDGSVSNPDDGDEDDATLSTDEDEPYPKMDVYLRETMRVIEDAISLGQNHDYWVSNHAPLTVASKG